MARIEADGAPGAGAEQLQHAAGAGAEVEQIADAALVRARRGRRASTAVLRRVQRAQAVPFGREPGEEGLRRFGALPAHGGEPLAVGGEAVIGAVERGEDGPQDRGARRPRSASRKKAQAPSRCRSTSPRVDEQLQVARDARLRLAEDVGQIGHGQFALGEQRQDAQARLLGGGPQGAERLVQGGCAVGQFGTPEEI